ncbi:hypothetical protein V8F33_007001 [Rhypophila sp. PSN 637]
MEWRQGSKGRKAKKPPPESVVLGRKGRISGGKKVSREERDCGSRREAFGRGGVGSGWLSIATWTGPAETRSEFERAAAARFGEVDEAGDARQRRRQEGKDVPGGGVASVVVVTRIVVGFVVPEGEKLKWAFWPLPLFALSFGLAGLAAGLGSLG